MNGVIYARYSSERQTEQSIEGQLRDCMRYAKENEINIVETYIDRAMTGRNDNRDDFQRMLKDSEKKLFEKVIVWKMDRFGRNREDIAKNKAILRRNGAVVVSAMEAIPEGPEGILLESVIEGLAEYYSAELSQKIKRGMRESAYKCQFNGSGLALGYKVDKEHAFHVDNFEAEAVKKIFSDYINGKTMSDIARELNAKGLKTRRGKEFSVQSVTRILHNRQYIGVYSWGGITTEGGIPRIIDDETFYKADDMLNKNKKTPARKHGEDTFLLTGKVFCGKCGGSMAGDSGTGKSGNKFYYYSCRNKKIKHTCDKKSVKREWLEDLVVKITVENVLTDENIEYIAERVVAFEEERRKDRSKLDSLKHKLIETEKTISNIMKAIEAGIFTETTGDRLRELETERANLKDEIAKETIALPQLEKEEVIFFLERFRDGDVDDYAYRQKLVDAFVNKVFVFDDKIVITYNYSANSGKNAEITAEFADSAADSPSPECSDCFTSRPPIFKSSNTKIFFGFGVFGLETKIADEN